ncbi:MAG: acyl-CoA carboxylase subunit beta [Nitrososphaerales archaeon]|nr:acyl-CoA carboxylase subunit beta [Nitrososphaerales archaeon]
MDLLDKLNELNKLAELGGGQERIDSQHKKGKLTARERIQYLLDPGTFHELDKFVTHRSTDLMMDKSHPLGDGVVTGYGKVNGRLVYLFAHDFTVFGGSLSEAFGRKVNKVMDLALKNGAPIVGINDSGGARIQEGVLSLAAYSEVFYRNIMASGVVPQINAIVGPCAGGAVYGPALGDFTVMVEGISQMFVTGPDVVKAALGQNVTFEDLGRADIHAAKSGVADFVTRNEQDCFTLIRRLLSYLPENNSVAPPHVNTNDPIERRAESLREIVPIEPRKPYDMRDIIKCVFDKEEYLEVQANFATTVTVGFGRLDGDTVGIVANQPLVLAGVLDSLSSVKAARFVRLCDSFSVPIVTFVDVPGYMPGAEEEQKGIIKHGSKLLFAYCEATVPKITIITRKAYGGAYCAMGSKFSKADFNYAWPTAEIAVMGPEEAINVIFRKEIAAASDREAMAERLTREYREKFANPYAAAARGIIDEVIDPAETRPKLASALWSLRNKREFRPYKKHGNIQL